MEEKFEGKTTYYLFKKERVFFDKTLTTFYFKSNKQVVKKSRPIDIDGIRFKLDLESGELLNYRKSEVNTSMNASIKRTRILLNMLLEMNDFDWFCTLTFDKEKIDRTNDLAVFNCYEKYINNIKKQFPSLRYICVPERHEKKAGEEKGCLHFHLLIGGLTFKQLGLENSGKVCCSWARWKEKICSRDYFERTKNEHELTVTDGLPVYNVTSFAYGFTTASKIASRERCNSYIKTYVDKALGISTDIFKKRFYYSSNLKVPAIVERLIGADFKTPETITELNCVKDNFHVEKALSKKYYKDYNIFQFWEDNSVKQNIDRGLISLSEEEINILGGII